MTPRTTRQLTPYFHDLGWQMFQKLCNELFSHEPDTTSDEYGTQGQRQHGIDLLATIRSSGIGVGQCKCEVSFSEKKIRAASDEFFRYWTHWKDKGVRRFILFVACDVTRTELQNEMLNQRARFARNGIDYELWGAVKIQNKLRPHRIIARTYIDSEEIVSAICGPVIESAGFSAGLALVTQRLGVFATELEEARGKELEALREKCRAGEQSEALAGLRELREASTWGEHTASFRARVLRFEATLRLNLTRDTATAAELIHQARRIDSNADFQTIDAYLAYCCRDLKAALMLVENPKSTEAQNLRWDLLLESGDLDQLANESASPKFPLDADSYRILTFLALAHSDMAGARMAVAKAIELAPERRNIRLAKAKADYFSALSPAAKEVKRWTWPAPINWSFVKRDAVSAAALCAAENEFIISAGHSDCSPAERETLQVWRLACVACVDQRQSEAARLVQAILAENPANFGAIAWAVHRGYPIDTTAAMSALRQRLQQEPDQIDVWLTLWCLMFQNSDPEQAEAVVDEGEAAFQRSGNGDLWLFHKAQLVARTDRHTAVEQIRKIDNAETKSNAELAILRASTQAEKSLKKFVDALVEGFSISKDPSQLFECCELKLKLRDYGFIAQHAKMLIDGIGTVSALRLALTGVFQHGDYALCLSLLQSYRHFFPEGSLSPDVRHLKAVCHHQLGDWPEAAKQAGQIYHDQPSLTTFLAYFELLFRGGDTRLCAVLARDLLTLSGAKPVDWLKAAAVVRWHDSNLAKELWRLANRRPINNLKLAGYSLELAFSLGLAGEAESLFKKLALLARRGRGPLRAKSYEDIVKFIRAERETEIKNLQLYEQGTIPIHLLSERHNRPLILAFHSQLETNPSQANLLHAPVLFVRSGARSVELRQTPINLIIDVSSLILAADLGILAQVEESFAPLFISPHTTISLFEEVTRLNPSQPERHGSRRKFLELVRSGRIILVDFVAEVGVVDAELRCQLGNELTTLLELAAREKGVVIHDGDFLAKNVSAVSVVLPAALADYVVPSRVLRSGGCASTVEPSRIADGAAVLVPASVLGSFAPADIEAAAARFRIMITCQGAHNLECEVAAFEDARNLAEWTQALLDRIQRGITAGRYRVLRRSQAQNPHYEQSKPATRALLDLLTPSAIPDGLTWCDDRMVNQHLHAGDRVVVGVSEILVMLRTNDVLTEKEFFNALLCLRRSNARYLPMAEGEIEYHLLKAEVKEGRLLESDELAVLRRYVNSCMLDRSRLQAPQVDSHGNLHIREFEFILNLRRAADESLQAVWKSTASIKTKAAQADWVLENIHLDLLGVRQAQVDKTSADEARNLAASSIAMLYTGGISFDCRAKAGKSSIRQSFFEWIAVRVLSPIMGIDPAITSLAGKVIGSFITSALGEPPLRRTPDDRKVECFLWGSFIRDLPLELQNELQLPNAVETRLDLIVHGPSVRVGDRIYPSDEYWEAVAEAVNGRKGSVRERGEAHELTFRFLKEVSEAEVTLECLSDDPRECGHYAEDSIPVLFDDIKKRIDFMESRACWFDCDAAKQADAIQNIARITSPSERFTALNQWCVNSPEHAYRHLGTVTSRRADFTAQDLLLPDWARLPDHLRLSCASTAEEGFRAAAEILHREEGLSTALHRLMCFPRRLPETLEVTWCDLPEVEVARIFQEIRNRPHSLVADLHLLRLAALRPIADMIKHAEGIASYWLDPVQGVNRFECFKAVLKLVEGQFIKWSAGRQLPPWLRLSCIWYHSSRVHGFLRPADEELPRFTDWLSHNTELWTGEVLARETAFWSDLARARYVNFGNLVLNGLINMIGGIASAATKLSLPMKLKALLEQNSQNASSIRLELFRRSDLTSNILNSFLGDVTLSEAEKVFGQDFGELFTTWTNDDINAYLEGFAKTPNELSQWAIMHSLFGEWEMPEAPRVRFLGILRKVDFTALAHVDPRILGPALTFSIRQANASGDEALIQQLEETIMKLARFASEQASGGLAALPLWQTLPNALLALAIVPGEEEASAHKYFDLLRQFAELCPAFFKGVPGTSTEWMKRLPFAQQINIWPFIFTLRALR